MDTPLRAGRRLLGGDEGGSKGLCRGRIRMGGDAGLTVVSGLGRLRWLGQY